MLSKLHPNQQLTAGNTLPKAIAVTARAKHPTAADGREREGALVQKCRAMRTKVSSATTFQTEWFEPNLRSQP